MKSGSLQSQLPALSGTYQGTEKGKSQRERERENAYEEGYTGMHSQRGKPQKEKGRRSFFFQVLGGFQSMEGGYELGEQKEQIRALTSDLWSCSKYLIKII